MAALSPIGRALAIARTGKAPPRPGPVRVRNPSVALVEREYSRRLRALVAAWGDHVEALVRAGLRADAIDDDLESAWRRLVDASGLGPWLDRNARDMGAQQARYLERVAGVPINSVANAGTVERFRQENLSYIRSLPQKQIKQIGDIMRPAQAGGQRWEEVAEQIEERLGVTANRAKLIARDQTNKFNAALQRSSQEAAGIEEYTWTTANDYAVRGRPGGEYEDSEDNHWKLHGKIFRWDSPPIVNPATGERAHPGQAIQCRCQAVPVVPYFGAPPVLARNPEIAAQEERLRREGLIGPRGRKRAQVQVPARVRRAAAPALSPNDVPFEAFPAGKVSFRPEHVNLRAIDAGLNRVAKFNRDPESYRPSSFATVRSVRANQPTIDPVRVNVSAEGEVHLEDGRHRLAVALERGESTIQAVVRQRNAEGDVVAVSIGGVPTGLERAPARATRMRGAYRVVNSAGQLMGTSNDSGRAEALAARLRRRGFDVRVEPTS